MKEDIKNNTGDIAEVFKNLGNTFKSTSTEFSDLMMTIAGGIFTGNGEKIKEQKLCSC